jgi:hypothetical protein
VKVESVILGWWDLLQSYTYIMMRLSEYEERRQWKMIRWMGAKQLKRERERETGGGEGGAEYVKWI